MRPPNEVGALSTLSLAMSHFPPHLDEVRTAIDEVRPHLEPERFDVARTNGLTMTSGEAFDFALNFLDDA